LESENWDESPHHESLETQPKPLWALKLLNQSWPHFWVMVNPFQGSEGSSNNDRGTFKTFPSLTTQDAIPVFFTHSEKSNWRWKLWFCWCSHWLALKSEITTEK
jgi:hypothetical protein